MTEYILVLTTVPDKETGRTLTEKLLEERLAACVTQSAACDSSYWWEGKITREQEHLLIIKTRSSLFSQLESRIQALHPYDVPEIIALPISAGSKKYLDWIQEETE